MADEPEPTEEPAAKQARGRSSKRYLDMILEAEKAFKVYQDKCDNIDKMFADLEKLASAVRDRQFQMFWANLEVLKPSVYSRPPKPVIVPRFKDRKPVPREASILLERAATNAIEHEDIDWLMRQVRDDLCTSARGVAWVRYETIGSDDYKGDNFWEKCCLDHLDRKDFLHDPARNWKEVEWVARGSWLNRKRGTKRFGPIWKEASFQSRKAINDDSDQQLERKARVWELWHKTERRIIWVSPGIDTILDEKTPEEMIRVEGFFPCPRPAYGTTQRRSLKPVPDFLQYKDQLEEINELTERISALSEALRLKGFYAGGGEDVGDVIEAAIKATDQNAILIPVPNFAAMGGAALKDAIIWLPTDMVAKTIVELVNLRKQLIDDVYQITGLSDIMRGATDPNETLGAQELKSQYGSIRIRDRQNELVRLARDLIAIMCEIMAENFQVETLVAMSQTELPRVADLQAQAEQLVQQKTMLEQQVADAQADPATMQQAEANPEQAQQMLQQAQQQISAYDGQLQTLQNTVTLEAVIGLLRAERLRPFILDIETDSTIQPDENAAKQRATEFATAVGGFIGQSFPMMQTEPKLAPFVGAMLKFISSPFRAGRDMEGTIDELVDQMNELAGQPKPPNPKLEAEKAKAEAAQAASQAKMQESMAKMHADQQQAAADLEKTKAEIEKIYAEIERIQQQASAAVITATTKASQPQPRAQ
jgi:hypothetical protein